MDAAEANRYRKFGNNYFKLETPSGEVLTSVLLELPAFNFSTKWEESPAAAMGEELYKLVNKPEIEYLASTVQGADVMRRTGNLTSKVYENAEPVSFELKFRCYPGQAFGDDYKLSAAEDWIDVLESNTTISSDTNISVDKIATNLKNVVGGGNTQIFGIVDDVKSLLNMDEKDNSAAALIKKQQEQRKARHDSVFSAAWQATFGHVIKDSEIDEAIVREQKVLNEKGKALGEKFKNITNTYGNERVKSSVKNFGASLFKLHLYPFIFNNPFVIYISSWNVKPSKEYNMSVSDNYYYDFTISCTMDRIPSAATWQNDYLKQ